MRSLRLIAVSQTALEALDQAFTRDETPTVIASTVRENISPVFEKWPAAEVAIRKCYAQA